jgi:hypothetical protein
MIVMSLDVTRVVPDEVGDVCRRSVMAGAFLVPVEVSRVTLA